MAKIKVTSDKFTQSARVALYDERLSTVEKVIVQALYDNTWGKTNEVMTLTSASLMKIAKCSNKTLYAALSHLEECGYILKRVQDTKNRHKGGATHYFMAEFDEVREVPVIEGLEWRFNADTKVSVDTDNTTESVSSDTNNTQTRCTNNCDTVETPKEETKVVRKPIKRTLKKVEKPTTPSTEKKPTSKPVFSRGYENTTHTNIPGKNDPLTAWSGYDGTALAERDKTRGPLKGGKRVYTVLGQKFPMVMQEDGETVNLFASEVKTFSPTVMRYFKIPHYTAEQWADIKKGAKRA